MELQCGVSRGGMGRKGGRALSQPRVGQRDPCTLQLLRLQPLSNSSDSSGREQVFQVCHAALAATGATTAAAGGTGQAASVL